MTFQTGTNTEVLYCMPAAGAALANSTAAAIISANTSTNPPYQLPPIQNLFGGPSYAPGRAMRVVARGTFGTTGSPTFTLTCGLNVSGSQGNTGFATGVILAATGAFTAPTTITNGIWELEFGIDINSIGDTNATAALSLDALGRFILGSGNNAATAAATAYMVGSATAITTVVPQNAYWVELVGKWGTASASNTITCLQFEVLGLN
jgi:hypothetical protein